MQLKSFWDISIFYRSERNFCSLGVKITSEYYLAVHLVIGRSNTIPLICRQPLPISKILNRVFHVALKNSLPKETDDLKCSLNIVSQTCLNICLRWWSFPKVMEHISKTIDELFKKSSFFFGLRPLDLKTMCLRTYTTNVLNFGTQDKRKQHDITQVKGV